MEINYAIAFAENAADGCSTEALRDIAVTLVTELRRLQTELAQLRAAKAAALEQKPVAFWWIGPDGKDNGGPYRGMASEFAIDNARNMGCKPQLLYAAPAPTPATVPDEWRNVLQECADDLAIELDMRYQYRHQYPSEQRKYNNEMQLVLRARALLQSAKSEVAAKAAAPDGCIAHLLELSDDPCQCHCCRSKRKKLRALLQSAQEPKP